MAKKLLFFLVDDDEDDREIFTSALHDVNSDVKCITAENGWEALQLISKDEQFIPDFIFLDLNMPKIDGKKCLVELRKLKRFEKTPIYIYSTSSHQKNELIELGANEFIKKSFDIRTLSQILTEITAKITLDK